MKVLLADDHVMMRDGLRAVLEKAGIEVIGEASDGPKAVAEAIRLRPDVVVMDVAMPEMSGVEATRRLTKELPGIKVIGLSMYADRRYVTTMMESGAVGYVLKNAAADQLLEALSVVMRGETYFNVANDFSAKPKNPPPTGDSEKRLTPRERDVLQLLAQGKSSKEISALLGIAVPTVETHRRQIADKLGLRSIAELTKYAIREGLTSAE